MVNVAMNSARCRACPEISGDRHGAFCFCAWLNQEVWGDSVVCPHGENLNEAF